MEVFIGGWLKGQINRVWMDDWMGKWIDFYIAEWTNGQMVQDV